MASHLTLDDIIYTDSPEADATNFDSLLPTLPESVTSNMEAALGRFLESLDMGADAAFPVPADASQPLELMSTPISGCHFPSTSHSQGTLNSIDIDTDNIFSAAYFERLCRLVTNPALQSELASPSPPATGLAELGRYLLNECGALDLELGVEDREALCEQVAVWALQRSGALFVEWCLSKGIFVDDTNNAPEGEQVRQSVEKPEHAAGAHPPQHRKSRHLHFLSSVTKRFWPRKASRKGNNIDRSGSMYASTSSHSAHPNEVVSREPAPPDPAPMLTPTPTPVPAPVPPRLMLPSVSTPSQPAMTLALFFAPSSPTTNVNNPPTLHPFVAGSDHPFQASGTETSYSFAAGNARGAAIESNSDATVWNGFSTTIDAAFHGAARNLYIPPANDPFPLAIGRGTSIPAGRGFSFAAQMYPTMLDGMVPPPHGPITNVVYHPEGQLSLLIRSGHWSSSNPPIQLDSVPFYDSSSHINDDTQASAMATAEARLQNAFESFLASLQDIAHIVESARLPTQADFDLRGDSPPPPYHQSQPMEFPQDNFLGDPGFSQEQDRDSPERR